MKRILFLFSIAALVVACNAANENPQDLESKKALLTTKKTALKTLQAEIDALKEEIGDLEPERIKDTVLVTSQVLEPEDFSRFVSLQASVMSDDVVFASSETGGRILRTYFKEGQNVKKGQLLATLDLETLEKQKEELTTSLDLATTVYERQKRLWDQDIGSEIQYLQAKNNKERIEKSLETLESSLAKKNVYAPISGVIDQEFLKGGEMAAPGSPIFQILDTRKVKVVADIPESYLGKIKMKDQLKINFPALDKEIESKVSLIGRTIDPANRTFKVEMETNNYDGILKPNLLAEVLLNDYSEESAIVIPLEILQEEVGGKRFIYMIDKDRKAKKSFVEIGESYQGKIIIKQGLQAGEEVILEGARNVAEGDPVMVISDK